MKRYCGVAEASGFLRSHFWKALTSLAYLEKKSRGKAAESLTAGRKESRRPKSFPRRRGEKKAYPYKD